MSNLEALKSRYDSVMRATDADGERERALSEKLLGAISEIGEWLNDQRQATVRYRQQAEALTQENEDLRFMLHSVLTAIESKNRNRLAKTMLELESRLTALSEVTSSSERLPEADPVPDAPVVAAAAATVTVTAPPAEPEPPPPAPSTAPSTTSVEWPAYPPDSGATADGSTTPPPTTTAGIRQSWPQNAVSDDGDTLDIPVAAFGGSWSDGPQTGNQTSADSVAGGQQFPTDTGATLPPPFPHPDPLAPGGR